MPVDPKDYTHLWKDRIVSHPGILGGKPIIKGTRLSVEFVTDRVCTSHATVEVFLDEYGQLTRDDVNACLEYAATGAQLSNFSPTETDQAMNERDEQRKKKWLANWQNEDAAPG